MNTQATTLGLRPHNPAMNQTPIRRAYALVMVRRGVITLCPQTIKYTYYLYDPAVIAQEHDAKQAKQGPASRR